MGVCLIIEDESATVRRYARAQSRLSTLICREKYVGGPWDGAGSYWPLLCPFLALPRAPPTRPVSAHSQPLPESSPACCKWWTACHRCFGNISRYATHPPSLTTLLTHTLVWPWHLYFLIRLVLEWVLPYTVSLSSKRYSKLRKNRCTSCNRRPRARAAAAAPCTFSRFLSFAKGVPSIRCVQEKESKCVRELSLILTLSLCTCTVTKLDS